MARIPYARKTREEAEQDLLAQVRQTEAETARGRTGPTPEQEITYAENYDPQAYSDYPDNPPDYSKMSDHELLRQYQDLSRRFDNSQVIPSDDPFEKGVNKGIHQLTANTFSFVEALGETIGVDFISEWGNENKTAQLAMAAHYNSDVPTLEGARTFGQVGEWFLSGIGEQLPQLIPMAVGGLGGAKFASKFGKEILESISPQTKLSLLKKFGTDDADKLIESIGGTAGAVAGGTVPIAGEYYNEQISEGVSPEDAGPRALAAAPFGAMLDAIMPLAALGRLKHLVKETPDSFVDVLKTGGKEAIKGVTLEAPTEVGQELIGKALVAYDKQSKGEAYDIFSEENKAQLREAAYRAAATGGTLQGASATTLGAAQVAYDKTIKGINHIVGKLTGDPTKATFTAEQAEDIWNAADNNIVNALSGNSEITDEEAMDIGYNALIALNAYRQRDLKDAGLAYAKTHGMAEATADTADMRTILIRSYETQLQNIMGPFAEQINTERGPERSVAIRRAKNQLIELKQRMDGYATALKNSKSAEETAAIITGVAKDQEDSKLFKVSTSQLYNTIKRTLAASMQKLKSARSSSMVDSSSYDADRGDIRASTPSTEDQEIAIEDAMDDLARNRGLTEEQEVSFRNLVAAVQYQKDPNPEDEKRIQDIPELREILEQVKTANRPANATRTMWDLFGDVIPTRLPLVFNMVGGVNGLFSAETTSSNGKTFLVTSQKIRDKIAELEDKYPGHEFEAIQANESILVDEEAIKAAKKELELLERQQGAEDVAAELALRPKIAVAKAKLQALQPAHEEQSGSFQEGVEGVKYYDSEINEGSIFGGEVGHVILAKPKMVLVDIDARNEEGIENTLTVSDWDSITSDVAAYVSRGKYRKQPFKVTEAIERLKKTAASTNAAVQRITINKQSYDPVGITNLGLEIKSKDGAAYLVREDRRITPEVAFSAFIEGLHTVGVNEGFTVEEVLGPDLTREDTIQDDLVIYTYDDAIPAYVKFGAAREAMLLQDRLRKEATGSQYSMLSDAELESHLHDSELYTDNAKRDLISDIQQELLNRYRREHKNLKKDAQPLLLVELENSGLFNSADLDFIRGLESSVYSSPLRKNEDVVAIHKFIKSYYLDRLGRSAVDFDTNVGFAKWKARVLQHSADSKTRILDILKKRNGGQELDITDPAAVTAFINKPELDLILITAAKQMIAPHTLVEAITDLEATGQQDSDAAHLLRLYSFELVQDQIETLDVNTDNLLQYYAGTLRANWLDNRITELSDPVDSHQEKQMYNASPANQERAARGEISLYNIKDDITLSVGPTTVQSLRSEFITNDYLDNPTGRKVTEHGGPFIPPTRLYANMLLDAGGKPRELTVVRESLQGLIEALKETSLSPIGVRDPMEAYNGLQIDTPLYAYKKAIHQALEYVKLSASSYATTTAELRDTYNQMLDIVTIVLPTSSKEMEAKYSDQIAQLSRKMKTLQKQMAKDRLTYNEAVFEVRSKHNNMLYMKELILTTHAPAVVKFADLAMKDVPGGSSRNHDLATLIDSTIEQGADEFIAKFVTDILLDMGVYPDSTVLQEALPEIREFSLRPVTFPKSGYLDTFDADIQKNQSLIEDLERQYDLAYTDSTRESITADIKDTKDDILDLERLRGQLLRAENIQAVNASSGLDSRGQGVRSSPGTDTENFSQGEGVPVAYDIFIAETWDYLAHKGRQLSQKLGWDSLNNISIFSPRLEEDVVKRVGWAYKITHRPLGSSGIALVKAGSSESNRVATLIGMTLQKLKLVGFNTVVVDRHGLEALIDARKVSRLRQKVYTPKEHQDETLNDEFKALLAERKALIPDGWRRDMLDLGAINAVDLKIEANRVQAGELTYAHAIYTDSQLLELEAAIKSNDSGRTMYMGNHVVIYVDTENKQTWENTMTAAHEAGHAYLRAMLPKLATTHIETLKQAYIDEVSQLGEDIAKTITFQEWFADKFAGVLVGQGLLEIPTTFSPEYNPLTAGLSKDETVALMASMREITQELVNIHEQAIDKTSRLYTVKETLAEFLTALIVKQGRSVDVVTGRDISLYEKGSFLTTVNFNQIPTKRQIGTTPTGEDLYVVDERAELIHALESTTPLKELLGKFETPEETHANEQQAEKLIEEEPIKDSAWVTLVDIVSKAQGKLAGSDGSISGDRRAAARALEQGAKDLRNKLNRLTSPIMAATIRLERLGISPEIVNLFWQPAQTRVTKEGGMYKNAWFNSTTVQEGRWGQLFTDILPTGDKVARNNMLLAMQDETIDYNSLDPATQKLRDAWSKFLAYLREADPTLDISQGKMARIWNVPRMDSEREAWFQFLRDNNILSDPDRMDRLTDSIINSEKITKIEGIIPPSRGPIIYHDMILDQVDTKLLQEAGWLHSDPETVLLSSVHKAIRAAEFGKIFGELHTSADGRYQSFDPAAKLKNAVLGLNSAADRNEAEMVIQGILGQRGAHMDKTWRAVQNGTLAYMNTLTLLFSGVAQITELGGAVLRSKDVQGAGEALKSYASAAGSRKDMYDRYRAMGFLEETLVEQSVAMLYGMEGVGSWATTVNKKFFMLNGLKFMMDLSRVLAAKTGEDFILRHAGRATKGTTEEKTESIRYLEELGLNVSDVVSWDTAGRPIMNRDGALQVNVNQSPSDKILAERIQYALRMFIDQSLVHPNNAIRPVVFSDARFNALTHLKTFFYGYQHTVLAGIWNNTREREGARKMVPALIAAAMIMPLAAMSLSLRERIKYGDGAAPTDSMDFMEYMHELFTRGGGYGQFEPIIASYHARYYNGGYASSVSPTLGYGVNIGSYILDGKIENAVMRSTPILNQLPAVKAEIRNND
jgi:hypothetical protein